MDDRDTCRCHVIILPFVPCTLIWRFKLPDWEKLQKKKENRAARKKETQISIRRHVIFPFVPAHTACKLTMPVNLFPSIVFTCAVWVWYVVGVIQNEQKRTKWKSRVQAATTISIPKKEIPKENRSLSYRNKHNLHWYGFSPLCIRRCFVSVELSEKAFLQALHLLDMEKMLWI